MVRSSHHQLVPRFDVDYIFHVHYILDDSSWTAHPHSVDLSQYTHPDTEIHMRHQFDPRDMCRKQVHRITMTVFRTTTYRTRQWMDGTNEITRWTTVTRRT